MVFWKFFCGPFNDVVSTPDYKPLNVRMINELEKTTKEAIVAWGTIQAFTWRDWWKPWKAFHNTGLRAKSLTLDPPLQEYEAEMTTTRLRRLVCFK